MPQLISQVFSNQNDICNGNKIVAFYRLIADYISVTSKTKFSLSNKAIINVFIVLIII